jgi:UDP-N-acetyl-D-mannosaminuronic acid dehydrogenase
MPSAFTTSVAIVGGCGHVGLPLGMAFADRGLSTVLVDINQDAVDDVNAGHFPFVEPGADELLARTLGITLRATTDLAAIATAEHVIVVIGTPVDEHLNPHPQAVPRAVEGVVEHLRDGQLLILRSTLYPGVTALVEKLIARAGIDVDVACCPERIAEGQALRELYDLPQLVAARGSAAMTRAEQLFRTLTDQTLRLQPEEAELAKLFTNTWRYIRFAIANQLYMIANDFGLDYDVIRNAMSHDYPRTRDLPGAGFAAGPCLLKDTMQLAAFNNNDFTLGQAAMMVNEGLPLYLVARMQTRWPSLDEMTVGILGMAFKGESDDTRSSLSYKLKRILGFKAGRVLCTDPYVTTDDELVPLDDVVQQADVLIIGAPHNTYKGLEAPLPIVDIWNVTGGGVRV